MRIAVIIPIHNEESLIPQMLDSLLNQSLCPNNIILVNDHSTDNTQQIIDSYSSQYSCIKALYVSSSSSHEPGSKVVNAFYEGYNSLEEEYDLIGKFDADIILPKHYFEKMVALLKSDPKIGIVGGNLYIEKNEKWVFENISKKTKVRGPIKLYRKQCFKDIGGLKKSIGWDTVDELLARFHGWEIRTDQSLHVKHLKPTGQEYSRKAAKKQGEAFKKMRYGFFLSFIALGKLASKKKSLSFFLNGLKGYLNTKKEYIVSSEEGKFIRKYRWKGIKGKFSGTA